MNRFFTKAKGLCQRFADGLTAKLPYALITATAVCAIMAVGVFFYACATEPSPDLQASALPEDGVTLPLTEDAGMTYQDSLTFVGDSLTAHLISRGVLTNGGATTQVWKAVGHGGALNLNALITEAKVKLPTDGAQVTIAEAARRERPPILIITLGTDWGVAYLTETDFKACYTALVEAIKEASPQTAIILQSIFPVAAHCKILSNQKIDKANEWVKAVAAETECLYLDTQSVLKDANGHLKSSYCSSEDGIHLTARAYEVILAYIRTHAYTPS